MSPRDAARDRLADHLASMGTAYINTANLVRDGKFENFWITACLDAMAPLMLLCRDADDDEDET
jgi:hypothetical protein